MRMVSTLLALFAIGASAASAAALSSFASVECSIRVREVGEVCPAPYSDSHPFMRGSGDVFGTWVNHGVEEYGYLGSYDFEVSAFAGADYGNLNLEVRSYASGPSWLGPAFIAGETRAYAEASFEDSFLVPAPDATSVRFVFERQANNVGSSAGEGFLFLNTGCSDWGDLVLDCVVEPGGVVNLRVFASLDLYGYASYSIFDALHEADYSLRLIGTEVICYECEPTQPASDQRLFSQRPYPGVESIIIIPEPSTLSFSMIVLTLIALCRFTRGRTS